MSRNYRLRVSAGLFDLHPEPARGQEISQSHCRIDDQAVHSANACRAASGFARV